MVRDTSHAYGIAGAAYRGVSKWNNSFMSIRLLSRIPRIRLSNMKGPFHLPIATAEEAVESRGAASWWESC